VTPRRSLVVGALAMALMVTACARPPSAFPHRDLFFGTIPQDLVGPVPFDRRALQGNVVLVTFVATWCFPCLTDLTTNDALERDFGGKGFKQVLVGLDLEGRKVLEPFVAEYHFAFPVIVGDDRLRRGQTPFGLVRELPMRVLFDRRGEVSAAWSGVVPPSDVRKAVQALLSEPGPGGSPLTPSG
jgi:peroxiredoxin